MSAATMGRSPRSRRTDRCEQVRTALLAFATVGLMVLAPHGGAARTGQDSDPIRVFLVKLEQAVQSGNPHPYLALLAETAHPQRAGEVAAVEIRPGATPVAVLGRDREPTTRP